MQSPSPDTQRSIQINTRAAKPRIQYERKTNPTFADYLKSIEPFPGLDRDEERRLGHLLIAGRAPIGPMTYEAWDAREILIVSNLRLVVAVAAIYADQGVPLLDIVGQGNLGLIRAVDKYIPGRARFGTHATWWIREACSRYVISQASLIHLPRNVVTARHRIHKIERECAVDGVTLGNEAMAKRAAMTPSQVKRARATQEHVVSLDQQIAKSVHVKDGETITLMDTLADERAATAETHATRHSVRDELRHKLATVLSSRERNVLALRYGLGERGGETMTLKQTGAALRMSHEYVRTTEIAALAKLRASYDADNNPNALRQAFLFQAS